jgi:hypothetical protein
VLKELDLIYIGASILTPPNRWPTAHLPLWEEVLRQLALTHPELRATIAERNPDGPRSDREDGKLRPPCSRPRL